MEWLRDRGVEGRRDGGTEGWRGEVEGQRGGGVGWGIVEGLRGGRRCGERAGMFMCETWHILETNYDTVKCQFWNQIKIGRNSATVL